MSKITSILVSDYLFSMKLIKLFCLVFTSVLHHICQCLVTKSNEIHGTGLVDIACYILVHWVTRGPRITKSWLECVWHISTHTSWYYRFNRWTRYRQNVWPLAYEIYRMNTYKYPICQVGVKCHPFMSRLIQEPVIDHHSFLPWHSKLLTMLDTEHQNI